MDLDFWRFRHDVHRPLQIIVGKLDRYHLRGCSLWLSVSRLSWWFFVIWSYVRTMLVPVPRTVEFEFQNFRFRVPGSGFPVHVSFAQELQDSGFTQTRSQTRFQNLGNINSSTLRDFDSSNLLWIFESLKFLSIFLTSRTSSSGPYSIYFYKMVHQKKMATFRKRRKIMESRWWGCIWFPPLLYCSVDHTASIYKLNIYIYTLFFAQQVGAKLAQNPSYSHLPFWLQLVVWVCSKYQEWGKWDSERGVSN